MLARTNSEKLQDKKEGEVLGDLWRSAPSEVLGDFVTRIPRCDAVKEAHMREMTAARMAKVRYKNDAERKAFDMERKASAETKRKADVEAFRKEVNDVEGTESAGSKTRKKSSKR